MKAIKTTLLAVACAAFITACGGEPKVDLTSPEKANASIDRIEATFENEDDFNVFAKAYLKIHNWIQHEVDNGRIEESEQEATRKRLLDGKTANEVVQTANNLEH